MIRTQSTWKPHRTLKLICCLDRDIDYEDIRALFSQAQSLFYPAAGFGHKRTLANTSTRGHSIVIPNDNRPNTGYGQSTLGKNLSIPAATHLRGSRKYLNLYGLRKS